MKIKSATKVVVSAFGIALAPRQRKPQTDFIIIIQYNINNYYNNTNGDSNISSNVSKDQYVI